ncbi:DUF2975 domain-containing protein [Clostridium bovifaecis]|uniref:DUF2975 domain-containing protein n=1 Tax=Clostridium bovifaecis TaxID=2184719 RepID=A0A6I6F550_9CLOT|nr:DUF2975 domain-containing protein [Clostridium bovifaecis]
MKENKYKNVAKFLIITQNLLIAFGIIAATAVIINGFSKMNSTGDTTLSFFINIIIFSIGTSSLVLILYNLKLILKSVLKVNPFTMSNVKSLKNIAICCFVITSCYLINFFHNNQFKDFSLISIDSKGIHTDMEFLIFSFTGLFVLILAQVYKQAVEVKEENDYTV